MKGTFYTLLFIYFLGCFSQREMQGQSTTNKLKIQKVSEQGDLNSIGLNDAINLVRLFSSQKEDVQTCETDFVNQSMRVIMRQGRDLNMLLNRPDFKAEIESLGFKIEYSDLNFAPLADTYHQKVVKDCTDCGDQAVSNDLKEKYQEMDYGGDAIEINFDAGSGSGSAFGSSGLDSSSGGDIDLNSFDSMQGSSSSGSGESPFGNSDSNSSEDNSSGANSPFGSSDIPDYTPAQLDSIKNALFGDPK